MVIKSRIIVYFTGTYGLTMIVIQGDTAAILIIIYICVQQVGDQCIIDLFEFKILHSMPLTSYWHCAGRYIKDLIIKCVIYQFHW